MVRGPSSDRHLLRSPLPGLSLSAPRVFLKLGLLPCIAAVLLVVIAASVAIPHWVGINPSKEYVVFGDVHLEVPDIAGSIRPREQRSFSRIVVNKGSEPIRVTGLLTSCVCVQSSSLPLEVKGGSSGEILIGVSAGERLGAGEVLEQEFSLIVEASGQVHAVPGVVQMRVTD
jgi:hypothetical protein